VKWHLSSSSEHGDRTPRVDIKEHKALFDYEKVISIRLVVDKNGVLQESNLELEIVHEVAIGGKEERSGLGEVKVNVSEYVEATRQTQDLVQRRHLLQNSKVNSTLKVSGLNQ
jgi:EEIG1/EHBP1-like protein